MMKKLLLLLIISLVFLAGNSWGQTVLSAGDIAIIGFNFDNDDEVGFVTLVDLEVGTTIYFTDKGWLAAGGFRSSEGTHTWTATIAYNAGDVITTTWTTGPALAATGDQIIAYQGTQETPSLIYALNSELTGWQADATDANTSALPTGLTNGTTAIAIDEVDNGYYSGSTTSGTKNELLTAISNQTNWTTSNTRIDDTNWSSSFTVSSEPTNTFVQFASASTSVSEGAGTYNLTLSITNEDGSAATTCDVALTSGSNTDINNYSTQQVTFPAASATNQTVSITITDDAEVEDNETLTFTIQNISGGNSAAVGSQSTFDLTIEDNDVKPEPSNHATSQSATANSSSQITVSWTDASAGTLPDGYLVKAAIDPTNPTAPSDGTEEANTTLVKNIAQGTSEAVFTGLDASTTYNFGIYPYTNSETDIDYKTDGSIPTTSATTDAPLPNIVINEVDVDNTATDDAEFIELYDGGVGNTSLDGIVVVLFNGSDDQSYRAFDLDGYSTNAGGYFVIAGNSGNVPYTDLDVTPDTDLLQNGADAVAIYLADGTDFPDDTPVTTTNLIDALVYDTNDGDDAGLLPLLNIGQPQINEDGGGNSEDHSMQRVSNGSGGKRNTNTYITAPPTPGAANTRLVTIWTGTTNNDWATATNWDNGAPDATTNATIPYSGITNFPTISASSACYNLTVESDATVVGIENLTINGTATIQRSLTIDAWQYLTPPATGATANDVEITVEGEYASVAQYNNAASGADTDLQNSWSYLTSDTDALNAAQGYAVYVSTAKTIDFTGAPVTGNQTASITQATNNNWVFIGNAALAHLDWTQIAEDADVSGGVAYFYDPDFGDNSGNSLSPNYGSINKDGVAINAVTQYIPPMQGFFVEATGSGDNSLTLPTSGAAISHNTQEFYKSQPILRNFVRLSLNNETNIDEAVIYFKEDAENGYNSANDGSKFELSSKDSPTIYTLANNHKLTYNILQSLPVDVPVAFYSPVEEKLTLKAAELLDLDEKLEINLEDKATGTVYDLTETSKIEFNATEGENHDRFVLHLTTSTTGIESTNLNSKIYAFGKQVVIAGANNAVVTIYNLAGQKVHTTKTASNKTVINTNLKSGTYLVTVTTNADKQVGKVFIKQQ